MNKANRASIALGILLCLSIQEVSGHGYLSSPRSRNLVAHEDTVWWPITESIPAPETCPQCLNRGGRLARCGMAQDSSGGIRNYDSPKNALGGAMLTNVQANYTQGAEVVMDVTLTAHHKGHFVFSGCPISEGEIPSQECFDKYKLTFVEDLMHGGNYDANFPERAYIAPVDIPNYVPNESSSQGVMEYSFKMRLPPDLYGDLVLIQWYYLTANSCYHEGYQQYNWPAGWKMDAVSSMPCGTVSSDGTGSPEQFWNCAEVKIDQSTIPIPAPLVPPNRPPFPISKPTVQINPQPPSLFDESSGIAIPVGLPSISQGISNINRPSSAGSHGKTIVGYYASWQWYDRNKMAAPENMDFTKVQRVNYAFFQIDTLGNMWGTDSWGDPNLLFGPYNWNPSAGERTYCSWDGPKEKNCKSHNYEQGLIHLVHAAGAEIYPSLGGWTLSDAFPAMAANAAARSTFVQNCVDLILEYNFDGIDLDWEYPGYEDHSGTPQDRDNFKLLLNDIRAKLDELGEQTGRFYGLTAALPCGPRHIANMDIEHVASTLSELNLMTYDFHGAFSEKSGINAPLYSQGWGEDDFDVDSCVKNWLKGGGSRDKINIGLPFYGRSFAKSTGLNQPHGGADQAWSVDEGTPQYFNIVAKLPSMTQVWDKKTWTQYAYFQSGGLVSFDNENAICAKVEYANENNLGGFIIWELSGDMMEDFSTPLLDVTNKKLHNPDFNCGEPGIYPDSEEDWSTPVTPVTSPTITSPNMPIFQIPSLPTHPSAPVAFPTPIQPIISSPTVPADPVSTPSVLTNHSGLPATPDTFTIPFYPVSFQDTPKPNELSAGSPYNQSFNPLLNDQPVLFFCGDQDESFNIAESEPLELSFRYELHRNSGVFVADAMNEFKSSLLNGLAEKLKCTGASSAVPMLRTNFVEASQEKVKAIESTKSDMPDNDTPCSIAVSFDVPTVCQPVTGSLTAHVEQGTPSKVLREVAEEMLFFVRTSMAAGKYDSAMVKKVIYMETLTEFPLESNMAPSNIKIVPEPESEDGMNSSMIGIIFLLIVLILIGITLVVFITRKRRMSELSHSNVNVENKPGDTILTDLPRDSTEEAWKKALDTEATWRNALTTYGNKSSGGDLSSDEEVPAPNIDRRAHQMGPLVEQIDESKEIAREVERIQPTVQDENVQLESPERSMHIWDNIKQVEQAQYSPGSGENIDCADGAIVPVVNVKEEAKINSEKEQLHDHNDDRSLESHSTNSDDENYSDNDNGSEISSSASVAERETIGDETSTDPPAWTSDDIMPRTESVKANNIVEELD